MHRIVAGFAAVLAMATPALAQVPSHNAAPTELESVTVDGRRLSETIERFVDDVVAPPVGRGPARWDRKVCVGVANLQRDAAQVVVDRVSRIAMDLGLEPGDPGCSPNILVIATADGPALATALAEERRYAFRPVYAGAARSARMLERFKTSQEPVRWWHVSIPVHPDYNIIAVRIPGYDAPYVPEDASRLTTQIRNDLQRVFVIVDLGRIEGITFQQLGDYIGMVAMAQIDPEAETGAYDTVLNLFDAPGAVDGLTDWDRSYLSAVYDAELNRRASNQQGGEVAGLMLRDRQQAEREEAEERPDQAERP